MRIELTLPDTEDMKDHGWILTAVQLRVGEALGLVLDLIGNSAAEDGAPGLRDLIDMLTAEETGGSEWSSPEMAQLMNRFNQVFSTSSAWVSREGEPLTMILERGKPTLYILTNIGLNTLETRSLAFLIGNEWVDMSQLASDSQDEEDEAQAMAVMGNLAKVGLGLLLPENTALKVLPGTGLDSMALPAA